ncbi:MAG: metal-dependent hydrolase [Pseudomonadota bacterium]|nr:metal-dependent hydrolase [Pseudomonadota bacterium]
MLPERRDLTFKLDPERVCDWHPAGRHVTHFMNALSIFFPEGERFFINSVRHYRNDIRDPELKMAVVAFIGQEAMHSREHVEYNALMARAGLPADRLEGFVGRLLKRVRDKTPPDHRLSATIALEHFTAIMANQLLKSRAQVAGTTPGYADLWHWHALEETEHKAVAFDVYREVVGSGPRAYVLRVYGLLAASVIFWGLVFGFHLRMIRADRKARGLRGWWSTVRYLFLREAVLIRLIPQWLDYFKPGFHPWQHDNRAHLAEMDEVMTRAAPPPDAVAA